jgi:hypothetical protein
MLICPQKAKGKPHTYTKLKSKVIPVQRYPATNVKRGNYSKAPIILDVISFVLWLLYSYRRNLKYILGSTLAKSRYGRGNKEKNSIVYLNESL